VPEASLQSRIAPWKHKSDLSLIGGTRQGSFRPGQLRRALAPVGDVLATGELRRRNHHRVPVLFLYLTGAAKENFSRQRSVPRRQAARQRCNVA
jgi:hypothetical protein